MEDTKRSLWRRCEMTERDRVNQRRVLLWLLSWAVAWVLASGAIKDGWVASGAPAVTVALLPTLLGLMMVLAYWKFLRQADELQRKIQLEALALGFGAGMVGAVAYRLLERAGVVADADVSDVTVILMIVYAIAAIAGQRRYA